MKTTISMHTLSNLVMCNISFWDVNFKKYQQMLLTLDTGASITTISTDLLHKLGYDLTNCETRRITTASGIEYVKSLKIPQISIGGVELFDIEVYAHSFPQESFSIGVIGLNILKQFDICLLFSKNLILLDKLC